MYSVRYMLQCNGITKLKCSRSMGVIVDTQYEQMQAYFCMFFVFVPSCTVCARH